MKKVTVREQALLADIGALQRELTAVENAFDLVSDESLIEACIYQRKALLARYDHCIRRAKELGLDCLPRLKEWKEVLPLTRKQEG